MKIENIALFKRFLKTEGANSLFAGMYKQYHDKSNPDDVEEFLRTVDAKDAILGAFRFPEAGNRFGLDYWFEKAVKWEKVLESASTSKFYGWCLHNVRIVEKEVSKPLNAVSAYLHPMGDEKPTGALAALQSKADNQTPPKADVQKLDAWVGKDFSIVEQEPVPAIPKNVTEEQMALSGFMLFKTGKADKRALNDGEITINTKSGYRITFNSTVSKEIQNAKHMYVHAFSKEEAVYFLFDDNAQDGVAWRMSGPNAVFCNKFLVGNIVRFLLINEEQSRLKISKNMSKTDRNLFYKVTKK